MHAIAGAILVLAATQMYTAFELSHPDWAVDPDFVMTVAFLMAVAGFVVMYFGVRRSADNERYSKR